MKRSFAPSIGLALMLAGVMAVGPARPARAQAPTLDTVVPENLGSTNSSLGPPPGEGSNPFGTAPGFDQTLGGRPGASTPRVPTSVTMPGTPAPPPRRLGIARPTALPPALLPIYGSLELPEGVEEDGPAGGLTLDEAIDRLIRDNLDLKGKFFEIPQAQADVLTASLRANPLLYADSQFVPYGQYSRARPGGPNQYDLNISYPLDVTHKRQARTEVACRAKRVLEAQFRDAVRLQIDNLYTVYVDALAARETVRFAQASVAGLQQALKPAETKERQKVITQAEVNRVRIQLEFAEVGLHDAEQTSLKTKHVLAGLLNIPPAQADDLPLRGSIRDVFPEPPATDTLVRIAMENRPDLISYRLGVHRAEADVRLAHANRLSDIYVLYQPYTFQNNTPFDTKSATSWALGVTVPVPLYNRNQGNIERAKLNVRQTQVQLSALERQVMTEVINAEREYRISREWVRKIEVQLIPEARVVLQAARLRYERGDVDVTFYLTALREFNDVVRQYRDFLVRHRRAMLVLNTAVGRRILP